MPLEISKDIFVPRTGIEPAPTSVDMALNHARLPIPPSGQFYLRTFRFFYYQWRLLPKNKKFTIFVIFRGSTNKL